MAGLVLKLAPRERLLINGAALENGDRRGRMTILTPDANILRLRDAIHPDGANTPVKRACYAIQLVLSGDQTPDGAQFLLLQRIEELSQVFDDLDSRKILAMASHALVQRRYYQGLKTLRTLLPREERLLAAVPK